MLTVFRYTLAGFRGSILGWGLSLGAMGAFITYLYDIYTAQGEGILKLIESYPPEILAFMGGSASVAINTPEGFFNVNLASFPIIVGIFAIMSGSGLIAADEENGRLDLILAHPVSRVAFFSGRLGAFVVATVFLLALVWIGFSIPLAGSSLDVSWGQMALPLLSTFAVVLVFGTLALLLSMVLPARRLAAMTAGFVMVLSYFVSSLANLNEGLRGIARLLPYDYFEGGQALSGLTLSWFFGLLATSTLLVALAGWRFEHKDIRIGGEGTLKPARLFSVLARGERGK